MVYKNKHNMKGSSIKGGFNLKGYKVRGVLEQKKQKSKKEQKRAKKSKKKGKEFHMGEDILKDTV